jgi:hypothetical protein
MTSTSPAEHDPFFQLLTEALRAGPGSVQWGEAVARLRDGGVDGADEYAVLLRAREDIEMGRDYRKVSAGPGFTRKVLEAVEREGTRRGVPTATIVAILSGLVILGVIITVIVLMSRGGSQKDPLQAAIEKLESTSIPVSVATGSTPGTINGFRAVEAAPSTSSTQEIKVSADGVITIEPLDPNVVAVVESELGLAEATSAQLFISDSIDLVSSSAHEVVLNYRSGRATVDVEGRSGDATPIATANDVLKASIRFDRENAIVEAGGKRLYAGPHRLGDKPRYAGVRFIRSTDAGVKIPQIKSISVARTAPAEER